MQLSRVPRRISECNQNQREVSHQLINLVARNKKGTVGLPGLFIAVLVSDQWRIIGSGTPAPSGVSHSTTLADTAAVVLTYIAGETYNALRLCSR